MSSPVSSPLQKIKNPFIQRRRSLPSVRTRTTTRASLTILVLLILVLAVNEFRCHRYHCISRVSFYSSDDGRGGYVGGGAIIKRPGEETEGGVEVETSGHGDAESLEAKSFQETLGIDDLSELEDQISEHGNWLPDAEDGVLDMEPPITFVEADKKEDGEREPMVKEPIVKVEKIAADTPIPAPVTQTSTPSADAKLITTAPTTDLSLSTEVGSLTQLADDTEDQITWAGREDDPPVTSHFVTPTGQEDPIRVSGKGASNAKSSPLDLSTGTSPNFGAMEMGDLLSGAKAKA